MGYNIKILGILTKIGVRMFEQLISELKSSRISDRTRALIVGGMIGSLCGIFSSVESLYHDFQTLPNRPVELEHVERLEKRLYSKMGLNNEPMYGSISIEMVLKDEEIHNRYKMLKAEYDSLISQPRFQELKGDYERATKQHGRRTIYTILATFIPLLALTYGRTRAQKEIKAK